MGRDLPYLSTRWEGQTRLTNRQLLMKAGWYVAPLALWDSAVSNLCCSEIE